MSVWLIALALSWLADGPALYRQHLAVARVRALGGTVHFDYEYDHRGNHRAADPNWCRGLLASLLGREWFGRATRVFLRGTPATDADLAALGPLPHVRDLYLGHTRVSGAGLRHLAGWRSLELLSLKGLTVGDRDLRHLAPLRGLRRLELDDTRVTGAGFARLRGLRNLRHVSLERAPVSARGLARLRDVGVRSLDLWGVDETPELLRELRRYPRLDFLQWALDPEEQARFERRFPGLFVYSP